MTVLSAFLLILSIYLTAYVVYQLLLFVANALIADPAPFSPSKTRFITVLIPAHNEELYLPRLLASLEAQDYAKQGYRVTVIADNCTDGTAAVARKFDVDVLERTDRENRGKGHAIGWTLARLDLNRIDAIVVVDADSLAGPGFLENLNLQLERGDRVVQGYNAIANPGQSWFTRVMDVSRTISNDILHPAKRKLGLSSFLMGNGMCFDTRVLREIPWNAFTVGEDMEYYARLLLAGEYVGYCRLAKVFHQESVTLRQASSQRIRWSSGRFQALVAFGPSLLLKAIKTRSAVCLDATLLFVFPNPSLGMNLTIGGALLSAVFAVLTGRTDLAVWFVVLGVIQVLLFVVGALHTKDKLSNTMSLVLAPTFLAWKLAIDVLSILGVGAKRWKPTERKL